MSVPCVEAPSFFGSSNDKLIASLHQSAQGYVTSPGAEAAAEETGEEIATESTISEVVVPAAEAHQQPNTTVKDDKSQQYGVLLESLFG